MFQDKVKNKLRAPYIGALSACQRKGVFTRVKAPFLKNIAKKA